MRESESTIQRPQYGVTVHLFIGTDAARVKVHLCPQCLHMIEIQVIKD
jgi:hypothetical protein